MKLHHTYIKSGLRVVVGSVLLVGASALGVSSGAANSPGETAALQLLRAARVPASARLAHPTTDVVCQCEGAPDYGRLSSAHHFYVVAESPSAVEAFLTTHIPNGGSYDGSVGTTTRGNGDVIISLAITYPANGPHLYLKQLAYSMTKRSATTSWLRVDSQIVRVGARSTSELVTGATGATVTGYKTVGLSGSYGDIVVHVSGKRLVGLIKELNTLPLGPNALCMESLTGFSMTIALKSGRSLMVSNDLCGGPEDGVSMVGASSMARYTLSDPSCNFERDVVTLFKNTPAKGSRSALSDCETWARESKDH